MRIVRFLDDLGQQAWGEDLGDGSAALLARDPIEGIEKTGGTARIGRLLSPLLPRAIFGIGLNYRKHAAETGQEIPAHPAVFMKNPSAVQNPGDPIRLPRACKNGPEVDYEVEIAAVIGRTARDVDPGEALSYVLGYTVANDVSARRWQKQGGAGQWVRGKSFDTFCPLGPALVTTDQIPDPQVLHLRTLLNGRVMQDSSTADMIHTVADLVAFLSQDTTLLPGTVILTGTPEGVGWVRTPKVFLAPGDTISVEVEGIGALVNPVVG